MSIKIKALKVSNEGEFRVSKDIHSNFEHFRTPVYIIEYEEFTATGLKAEGELVIKKEKHESKIEELIKQLEEAILDRATQIWGNNE